MASSFPTSLDSLNNPSNSTLLNQVDLGHASQHVNINDAIEAIQARIGIEGSSNVNSLEYRLDAIETATGSNTIVQDTSSDWFTDNPILAINQIGIETDTLKIKFGTGDNWNDIQYTAVTPPELESSLEDYLLVTDRGSINGVASLDSSGKIPDTEIPSGITRDSELSAHNSATTSVHGISNTADLATKSYADTAASNAVSALIDSAPTALNTLNELAAAINDDASYAASITTALGLKQDKVSGVSDTEIGYLDGVTSAIQTQINAKTSSLIQFNQQSSSYTIQLSDKDKIVEMSGGGTVTIPAEATLNLPVGYAVEILQTGSSQVTIAGDGFTPNSTPGLKLRAQWSSASLIKRGSDLWIVSGDLSA